MNEEKPTFKVTDRRLFNPDGTPRDIEREAEATSAPAAASPASPETQTTAAATTTGAVSSAKEATPEPAPPAQAASEPSPIVSSPIVSSQTSGAAQEAAGDPTAFANLVMFIASPAAAAMGMTEHPGLAPGELDLPLAKHCIDLLATIQQKTRGNLGQQEQQILEGLLAELRMQFVSLTSTRPATTTPPRGFTGSDITGGR